MRRRQMISCHYRSSNSVAAGVFAGSPVRHIGRRCLDAWATEASGRRQDCPTDSIGALALDRRLLDLQQWQQGTERTDGVGTPGISRCLPIPQSSAKRCKIPATYEVATMDGMPPCGIRKKPTPPSLHVRGTGPDALAEVTAAVKTMSEHPSCDMRTLPPRPTVKRARRLR